MKRAILVLFVLVAGAAGQTSSLYIPVWTGTRYTWARLGSSITVTNGVIEAKAPAPRVVVQVLNHRPAWDSAKGGYAMPAGAFSFVVYRNGVRQFPGLDFEEKAGAIVPLYPWVDDDLIVCDYLLGPDFMAGKRE